MAVGLSHGHSSMWAAAVGPLAAAVGVAHDSSVADPLLHRWRCSSPGAAGGASGEPLAAVGVAHGGSSTVAAAAGPLLAVALRHDWSITGAAGGPVLQRWARAGPCLRRLWRRCSSALAVGLSHDLSS